MKRISNKRLALESERVKMLVVELSPDELRRVAGGATFGDRSSNTTTQQFGSDDVPVIVC